MTFVSEGCSEVLVSSGALPVLLDLVAKTNRSAASLHVVKTIIKILLNVTKVGGVVTVNKREGSKSL